MKSFFKLLVVAVITLLGLAVINARADLEVSGSIQVHAVADFDLVEERRIAHRDARARTNGTHDLEERSHGEPIEPPAHFAVAPQARFDARARSSERKRRQRHCCKQRNDSQRRDNLDERKPRVRGAPKATRS